jgi:hypothetical protein
MAEPTLATEPSSNQADNEFLAACNALLLAIATDSMLDEPEADTLIHAMPDEELRLGLRRGMMRRWHMVAPR